MKRKLHFFYFVPMLLLSVATMAQTRISGKVLDMKDRPIKGASVALDNTLDGGTTDSMGFFSFETTETGNQTLVATDATHSSMGMPLTITGAPITGLVLKMRTAVLDAVTITAGSFASGSRAATVMSPLDIVTTAGSNGDVVKAMQMMPGTQQAATENGLFIRGGDNYEAAVIVDGIVTQSAFASGPPGMATRSRFNAFQYQGVTFSSGGYSARFGQALSGILELNSTDLPDKSNVNLGINMAGVYASGTKRWKKSSLDIGGNYNNLQPMFALASVSNGFNFYKVPEGGGAYARFAWQPNKNGMFKATVTTSYNNSGITIPNPSSGAPDSTGRNPLTHLTDAVDFTTRDKYIFGTATYKQMFKTKYMLYAAASFSDDVNDNSFGPFPMKSDEFRNQFRVEGKDFFNSRLSLLVGSDVQNYGMTKNMGDGYAHDSFTQHQSYYETVAAGYAELEWTPKYWLALRPGVRYEHSVLLNKDVIAPRFSAAIKTGPNSSASLAGGIFYQDANTNYYLAGLRPGMGFATQYIANWQISKHDRTFRIEGYHKEYNDLALELPSVYNLYTGGRYRYISPYIQVDNNGHGHADGIELFWRDKKSVKNADYWISYSYINTKRQYENMPVEATPSFIAAHTLNVVGKYFVDKIHTNFSATYSFSSGYPYYDPTKTNPLDKSNFLTDKTPTFNNIALTVAYLHSFGKWFTVFYAQVDNIPNFKNVIGYRYNYNADGTAIANSKTPVRPALYRTIFVGVNMSLSQFSKDEL